MRTKQFVFIMLFMSLVISTTLAQPKPKQKEKAPTSKEMDDMMKEAQKMMDDIDPETKHMMDSMGIKMPDMKKMPKMTDAQLKEAWEDADRIVPKKDVARIAVAQSVTLTNSGVASYIETTNNTVLARLSAKAKTNGAAILQKIKSSGRSVGASAVGFWMQQQPGIALYLAAQACKADPSNGNNLNNYASFLTMCGAEQLALPILNNLNKRYPRNSTVLNNIAQAWLGLGDIDRAGKYADSVIRIYAYHPQANMTKCLVEESKGNTAGAIEAAKKAISKAYSTDKEERLRKLGYKLKSQDIVWDKPMPQDALGLAKFSWPDYPMEPYSSEKLEKEWSRFKELCQQQMAGIRKKREQAEKYMTEMNNARIQKTVRDAEAGRAVQPLPAFARKASIALKYLVLDDEGNMSFYFPKQMQPMLDAMQQDMPLAQKWQAKKDELDKHYDPLFGEGKPNPAAEACKAYNENTKQYLTATNRPMQQATNAYIEYVRKRINDLLYYYQWTSWPDQFEVAKLAAQESWLQLISDQRVKFRGKGAWCDQVEIKAETKELAQFDDIACKYSSTMNLGIFSITSKCSETTGKFDFGGVNIDMKDNIETGRLNGTVVIGASKGFEGPAGVEVEASGGGMVEFDNTGITNIGGKAGVDVNVGGNSVAGAETTITVNTGTSFEGKGILK